MSLDTVVAYGLEGMNSRKGYHDLGTMEDIIILRPLTFEGPSFRKERELDLFQKRENEIEKQLEHLSPLQETEGVKEGD